MTNVNTYKLLVKLPLEEDTQPQKAAFLKGRIALMDVLLAIAGDKLSCED
jgi:hypothetical protein